MKHVLKPLKEIGGREVTLSSDPTGELIEIDPDRNLRYVMILDVGDWPPSQVRDHVKNASEMMDKLIGPDRVLFAPRMRGQDGVKIYEMQPVLEWCDECKREKCECDYRRGNRGL